MITGDGKMKNGRGFPLQASLFYWHGRLAQHVDVAVDRQLAEFGVTYRQWSLMSVLFDGQADTVRGVAAVLRLDPGAVTRLATRLSEKALIKRAPDERDARSVKLVLTPSGREILPPLNKLVLVTEKAISGVLDSAELDNYRAMLARMLDATGDKSMMDHLSGNSV